MIIWKEQKTKFLEKKNNNKKKNKKGTIYEANHLTS